MKSAAAQTNFLRLAIAACAFVFVAVPVQAGKADQGVGLDVTRQHLQITADLANALVSVATEYQVPIVAELVATEDPKIEMPAGKATARQLLNWLVSKAPNYSWKEQAGVVHLYNTR